MKSFVIALVALVVTTCVLAQINTQKQPLTKATPKPTLKPEDKKLLTPIPAQKLTAQNGDISFRGESIRLQCLKGDYDPLRDE